MAHFSIPKCNSTFSFLIMLIVIFIIGCGAHKHLNNEKQVKPQKKVEKPLLTVFIHGTRLFPKFGLQEGFYSAPGMVKLSSLDTFYHTMHMIAQELEKLDPRRFSCDRFYAFGWSGKLDFDTRRETARELYGELKRIMDEYEEQHGIRPGIRLITHSHGGNVALNLAAVKNKQNDLLIDELIMLACPVQDETKNLLNDEIFVKRYALCSKGDLIQWIDPQGLKRNSCSLFSGRWFPNYPQVMQAKIKLNGRAPMHVEFIFQRFIRRLPEILDILDSFYEKSKETNKCVQLEPFPLIDLRAKTVRVSNWRHAAA